MKVIGISELSPHFVKRLVDFAWDGWISVAKHPEGVAISFGYLDAETHKMQEVFPGLKVTPLPYDGSLEWVTIHFEEIDG